MPLLVAGCATQRPVAVQTPPPVMIAAVSPTKVVETRYDMRSYREAANPSIRHEAHAVLRRTRVPVTASDELETVPRASYPPATVKPLPASEELTAELTTQKKITTELRAMHTSMAETEQRMQAQYVLLVRQSADALKLRAQLETERNRVRSASSAEAAPTTKVAVPTGSPEVKW
ncbi:MAG: hypothetical protein ABIY47_18265 [Opitutaceae bacterium]